MKLIRSAAAVSFSIIGLILFGIPGAFSASTFPIRIGAIYPFSGHSASTGNDIKAGIDLAVDIINNTYDLPIPFAQNRGLPNHGNATIEILFRDSRSDDLHSSALVKDLALQDKVIALIGCYNSTVTAAASEQAEALRIPFLNPDSTAPILTRRGLKWFFRTTPDDLVLAENFFSFFSDLKERFNHPIPRRLILIYENKLWGTSVARIERKLALKYGYEIVADIPYDINQTSFENELIRIRAAMPGIILQSSYTTDAILLMKGYKTHQINPEAILAMNAGFIDPSFLEHLGQDGNFIFSREVWARDMGEKKPILKGVDDIFFSRFGRHMNGNSARVFTGIMVLADAINRSKTLTHVSIRESLSSTEMNSDSLIMPWDGVSFDLQTGQNRLGKGIIVQIQNGIYQTVWPWEYAKTPPIWPAPAWNLRNLKKP
jgi:branched-chain amino acid transport system substrate-binding protein